MTLTEIFSKKAWARWKEKREREKDREMLLKDSRDIVNFVLWYLQRRYINDYHTQKDKDVNFVWLGFEAQAHFWNLVKAHPYVATLTGDKFAHVTARRRVYSWLDDEGNWNHWERAEMEDHYQAFIANEKVNHVYGDYSLEETGPLGKSEAYPACAYLSYAYHEEIRWQTILQTLISFLFYTE